MDGSRTWVTKARLWWPRVAGAGALAASIGGAYALSRANYLLFHTLIELVTIVMAAAIFVLAWNVRRLMESEFLLFVGGAYALVSVVDLLHTVTYKGMGVLPWADANLPTQLWIVARGMQALALVAAPFFPRYRLRAKPALAVLAACTAAAVLAIFRDRLGLAFWPRFPDCYIEGVGLTAFKIAAEYAICLTLAAALGALAWHRAALHVRVFRFIALSIAATILSELAFTRYVSVYGAASAVGHLAKLGAFYLVYRAIVETGMRRPYQLLHRELGESVTRLRTLFEAMDEGFAHHEIVTDEQGRPCDYRFLDVNAAFERLTGLKRSAVLGRTVRDVMPGTEDHWIEAFGRVALGGEPLRMEDYARALGRWYSVSAYRTAPGRFAAVFTDVTARRAADERARRNLDAVEAANAELRESRRAALNLVEDAVAARRRSEEAVRESRASQAALNASLAEKEVLLKEIHHRVKNNMQVLSSLVSLQAAEVKDVKVRAALLDMTHRVRSMAIVHEKLYQSGDLARVEFAAYARSLLDYLWRAHGAAVAGIRQTMRLSPVLLPVNMAVPCGLVLNELVVNALKHAFRGRADGEIVVALNEEHGNVRLSVRDNGGGLPPGFDWRHSGSLGLRLVDMLAGQLRATVAVSNDSGVEFALSFAVKEQAEG